MPGPNSTTVDLMLVPALDYSMKVVSAIPAEALKRPSPCPAWTVGDVLAHLVESLECLTAAMDFGTVAPTAPRSPRRTEAHLVAHELEAVGASLIAAADRGSGGPDVDIAGLRLPQHHLLLVGTVEAAVHGWDVAYGAGRPLALPEDLAELLLEAVPRIVNDRTRHGLFAAPAPVAAGASASDRLLAALGRTSPGSHGPILRPSLRTRLF